MALCSQTRLILTLPLLAGMMWGTQGDSSLQQQGPLITKTESHVLLIECRFPFSLAGMSRCCTSSVDLELTYKRHAQHSPREIIAKLLNGQEEPWKFERFENDTLVEARAVKIQEAKLEKEINCFNCRTLIVTMPGSYGPHGEYSCSAEYYATDSDTDTTRTTYTVSVDEKRSENGVNSTFTVENVLAHKLEVRRQDSESRLRRVSVSRTTVDSQGCPLGNSSTGVELFIFRKHLVNHSSKPDGVLLSSLATQKTSTLTLFVRKDPFCYPNCTYSCEVNGRRCPESTACKTCECPACETCECPACKYTPWVISICILIVVLIVLIGTVSYAFRDKIRTCKTRGESGYELPVDQRVQQSGNAPAPGSSAGTSDYNAVPTADSSHQAPTSNQPDPPPSNGSETTTSNQPDPPPSNGSQTTTSSQPHPPPSNGSQTTTSSQRHPPPSNGSQTTTSSQRHPPPSNGSQTTTSSQAHQDSNDPLQHDPPQCTAARGTSIHPIPEDDQYDARMSANSDGQENQVSSESSALVPGVHFRYGAGAER